MKILLDENLPKKLKSDLNNHEVFTVRDMNWSGKKNGELIKLMLDFKFDALLTFDKNMEFQQNFKKYELPVLVLNAPDNTYHTLRKLVFRINEILDTGLSNGIIEIAE